MKSIKAILVDGSGFTKEIRVDSEEPIIEMLRMPELDLREKIAEDVISVHKMIFYYSRSYLDENDKTVLIYKERL